MDEQKSVILLFLTMQSYQIFYEDNSRNYTDGFCFSNNRKIVFPNSTTMQFTRNNEFIPAQFIGNSSKRK